MKALLFRPLLLLLSLLSSLSAQQQPARIASPRIGYVYPAGGRQGTTFQILVGGQYLKDVLDLDFSTKGLKGRVLDYEHPLDQKEIEALREEGAALRAKRKAAGGAGVQASDAPGSAWTLADEKRAAFLRSRAEYRPNRQSAPAISEVVRVELSIGPDAAPGFAELRLRTANGLSNPLRFEVGLLPEFSEDPAAPNTALPEMNNGEARIPRPEGGGRVELPQVVNGQILPGEVDRIRFHARQGARILVRVRARALIPFLADAVPGWFQSTIALVNAAGTELAFNDDYRNEPDPVLCFQIPAEGDYSVLIKDALYRGRQDFIYRMTLGELPFITSIYPLGGSATSRATVELRGWNLSSDRAVVNAAGHGPGLLQLGVGEGGTSSNQVPYVLGAGVEIDEQEPNEEPAKAQRLQPPLTVNGRINRPGDRDVFCIEMKQAGDLVAEVFARRLGSPLDSILSLSDAQGHQLALNDDHDNKGDGLTTHHADSRLQVSLPAPGLYYLSVSDVQGHGGPEFGYRLQVGPPKPDFELRLVPSSINIRSGLHTAATVHVLRKDGFSGEVRLGLSEGSGLFFLSGGRIPAGQDQVRVTLGTRASARDESWPLALVGEAECGGSKQRRLAVPSEDRMQAFAYRHLLVSKEGRVQVVGKSGPRLPFMAWSETRALRLRPGEAVSLDCEVALGPQFGNYGFELSEPPPGLSLRTVSHSGTRWTLEFKLDPAQSKPATQGNLIIQVNGQRLAQDFKAKDKKPGASPSFAVGVLPALPFEVIKSP